MVQTGTVYGIVGEGSLGNLRHKEKVGDCWRNVRVLVEYTGEVKRNYAF